MLLGNHFWLLTIMAAPAHGFMGTNSATKTTLLLQPGLEAVTGLKAWIECPFGWWCGEFRIIVLPGTKGVANVSLALALDVHAAVCAT